MPQRQDCNRPGVRPGLWVWFPLQQPQVFPALMNGVSTTASPRFTGALKGGVNLVHGQISPPLIHGVWKTASLKLTLAKPPWQVDWLGHAAIAPASVITSGELRQKMSSVNTPPMPGGPCTST
jgi:hypothetical protein